VTDGILGAAVFDFKSVHDPLVAKKAWFFFENEYVCLGAGIASDASLSVVTTLNQSILNGDVSVGSGGQVSKPGKGEREIDNVNWVLHNGTGYLFPKPVKVNLSNQAATGSWFKINQQSGSPKETISLDVFKLWIDHGKRPHDGSYEYIIVPLAGTSDLNSRQNPEIISNTPDIQAVRHSGSGIGYVVFYKTGKIELFNGITVGSEGPAIIMLRTEGGKITSVSASDPSRRLSAVHLTLSTKVERTGNHFTARWNENKAVSELALDLPQDVYAGKSVTINLR
jgi:chondroitin AC lyase